MVKGQDLASDIKFYLDYSRWIETENRTETWEDSVFRVMKMHRTNSRFKEAFENPRFVELVDKAEKLYLNKQILGSQRALQFGGAPIMTHMARAYNCCASYVDRVSFFQECMYLLLCGCGAGFSVQKQHVAQLPIIRKRTKGTKTFIVPDKIEGWADAFGVLISSFISEEGKSSFPEYEGYEIRFDLSQIRPEGAMISGGYKAPGPEGLRKSLIKVEELLSKTISEGYDKMRSIIAYDIVMHMSDAVLSGGVRRSATICLFSYDDKEMMGAKTGNWNSENPQRARSNNSVVLQREVTTKEIFDEIFHSIKEYGEPGFYFVDDLDQIPNPCVEIGLYPKTKNGISGWQFCNLCEGNGGMCTTKEKFYEACEGLAILGTLQAAYTDFKYLDPASKEITEREALLGCSFTGWMANPQVMMDPETQRKGAEIIKDINKELSQIIGINQAARTTTCKPSGNSSVLLKSPSGCHGDHSPRSFRVMQINKQSEIGMYLSQQHPYLIEESVWSSNNTDYVAYIPMIANKSAKFKHELKGIKQLEVVKTIQENWVEAGTNIDLCVKPWLRHSVSNTVEVDNYDECKDYLFKNMKSFAAASFLPATGDKDYAQAPFTSILTAEEIFAKYGEASLFASGLIVDGLHAFENKLWDACELIQNRNLKIDGTRLGVMIKKDWLRRAKQFAKRFFKGDIKETTYCLKDLHLYHKWIAINRELKNKDIDFATILSKPEYTNIDTMGATACANGACDLPADYLFGVKEKKEENLVLTLHG
jgi:ribonucleoside-triphosphate reductase